MKWKTISIVVQIKDDLNFTKKNKFRNFTIYFRIILGTFLSIFWAKKQQKRILWPPENFGSWTKYACVLTTEICDSRDFGKYIWEAQKPITKKSRVIIFFWLSQMDQISIPHRPLIRIGPKSLISKVIHLGDDCAPPRTFV